ncbi:hypothetical protein EYZ11_003751 [Aspergillus tanneri]|uniref:RRM domain-containing protein n=1 Tax=Aspergillus tanneri TaxID=1220188 RepID=A0A4S3JMF6_9EURO|nr:hypothetical protein EYZ11_003751 [Aspergillus tanneri]
MTPSSPDEALHFRGKTLTPESPRPLHIAEPANIPVLQNQMDPVFNDTSTYEKSEAFLGDIFPVHHDGNPQALHAGPTDVNGKTGSGRGSEQPPPQTQAAHPQASPFAVHSTPSMATATSSAVQNSAANSSLTSFPPSDPAIHLAHPVPDVLSSPHAQSIPIANEVDHAVASWTALSAPQERLDTQSKPADNTAEDGVDFQNLLDNLPPPSTTAPPTPAVMGMASPSANDTSAVPQAASDEALQSSLGLPPRPPPQEKPAIHPNYSPSDDIRSYHQLPPNTPNTPTSFPNQQSNYQSTLGLPTLAAAGAPGTSSGASTLPPPPVPSFQQSPPTTASAEPQEPSSTPGAKGSRTDGKQGKSKGADDDSPWGPEVQKKYDEFLHNERIYVTEGLWDRFPPGSRLFVGNLPTERVTKRDLFHIFHKYGKLAQISIKQAYGFIQFLDSSSCKQALDAEQGAVIRGRKTSKFQNPKETPDPGPLWPSHLALPHSDARDLRNIVGLDLPPVATTGLLEIAMKDLTSQVEYRSVTFEMSLLIVAAMIIVPLDRRRLVASVAETVIDHEIELQSGLNDASDGVPALRLRENEGIGADVPEVQILVLEEVDRNFIFQVENAFRNRGLRVDILVLGPRIPLNAAVQRQIAEGVLAVVFDRGGGPDNIRFNEYPDVEPSIAAEIVFHAQSMQRGAPPTPFPPNPAFGVPSIPPASIPPPSLPALSNAPNIANMITSLDGPTLQSLLSALQQRPPAVPTTQQSFSSANTPQATADLASLLSAATRHPVPPANPPHPLHPQHFPIQAPNAPVVSDPNLISLLAKGLGGQQPQNQGTVAPHVQNIMNQLGKWKQ